MARSDFGVFVTCREYLSENVCSCVKETLTVSDVLHSSSVLTPRQTAVFIWTHSSSPLFHMLLLLYHSVFVCVSLNFMSTQLYTVNTNKLCFIFTSFRFFSFNLFTVKQFVTLCQTWFVAYCVHVFSPGRKCDPCEQYVRHLIVSPKGFAIQAEINVLLLWEGSHKCVLMTF